VQAGLKLSGRYVLDALLGYGGMGEVWRGADEHLGRPVAIKVLREHFADPELAERFRREARIAARLQHPGITVVHDVGSDNGQLFIVMELLHGRDLAAMLAEAPGGLSIDAAVSLTLQAADALQAAHAGHVIHRDLKPANLFVLSNGQLKICDFGIAWAVDAASHLTATGQAIGTPAYMSPEQCLGQRVDKRSDLYSLGCVLYALLTGQPPFTEGQPLAIMSQHLNAAPLAPRTIRADVPPELDHLVLGMLAKDPVHRPADASHVIATLRAGHYTPTVQVEPTAEASSRLNLNLRDFAEGKSDLRSMDYDQTMSAGPAILPSVQPSQPAALTQVPRTEVERQQILLVRPAYWEFLHFAGQLLYERESVEAKYLDHELRYAP
jgi:serine/threonine protein kinase